MHIGEDGSGHTVNGRGRWRGRRTAIHQGEASIEVVLESLARVGFDVDGARILARVECSSRPSGTMSEMHAVGRCSQLHVPFDDWRSVAL
jgi:hypothetical protein